MGLSEKGERGRFPVVVGVLLVTAATSTKNPLQELPKELRFTSPDVALISGN